MVRLYYSLVYSHLTYALLAWGRSGLTNAAKIECAHRIARKLLTDYNQRILNFRWICDNFALSIFERQIIFSSKISFAQHHDTEQNSDFNTKFLVIQKHKNVICAE